MRSLTIRVQCARPLQALQMQKIKINYLCEVDPYLILPGLNIWNVFLLC